jgi:hypothetical protein
MENIDPQTVYPYLFNAFRKIQIMPPVILREFRERSEPVRFRHKEVIADGALLSTHGYFIIDGLIRCYVSCDNGHHLLWVRGENDYAYSMDMFRDRYDPDPHLIGNVLIALEDTLAIKIAHEDITWLRKYSREMSVILDGYAFNHSEVALNMEKNKIMRPLDRYQEMQQLLSFDLSRVPDLYLASWLDITLVELKKVRERIR